jgi:putative DNA primase/helicase
MDEIEKLSSESASTMREVLNAGYRRGATVPRMKKDVVVEYPVYGPKAFAGIGAVYDTLRDRTIAIVLRRADGEVPRMIFNEARADGNKLALAMLEATTEHQQDILDAYVTMRLPFLTDRDEEIWLPLFALCKTFAPHRVDELKRIAVDMATSKTQAAEHHRDLAEMETAAQDDEYATRLLHDLHDVMKGKHMWSEQAVEALRAMDTAPWRKYRGEGITQNNLADILNRFGVVSVLIKMQKRVARGYRIENVKEALQKHFGKR